MRKHDMYLAPDLHADVINAYQVLREDCVYVFPAHTRARASRSLTQAEMGTASHLMCVLTMTQRSSMR